VAELLCLSCKDPHENLLADELCHLPPPRRSVP
jgi:hypothetical protein